MHFPEVLRMSSIVTICLHTQEPQLPVHSLFHFFFFNLTFENIEKYIEFIQNYAEPLHVRFCLLGHFGRDKTESKISERYYCDLKPYKNLVEFVIKVISFCVLIYVSMILLLHQLLHSTWVGTSREPRGIELGPRASSA